MAFNVRAFITDGNITLAFEQPTAELVFTHEQAFQWGDQLSRLGEKALGLPGSSALATPDDITAAVQIRGILVTLKIDPPGPTKTLTTYDAIRLGDELILASQTAEKVQRSVIPGKRQVDRMFDNLLGTDGHNCIQHPLHTIIQRGQIKSIQTLTGLTFTDRVPLTARLLKAAE